MLPCHFLLTARYYHILLLNVAGKRLQSIVLPQYSKGDSNTAKSVAGLLPDEASFQQAKPPIQLGVPESPHIEVRSTAVHCFAPTFRKTADDHSVDEELPLLPQYAKLLSVQPPRDVAVPLQVSYSSKEAVFGSCILALRLRFKATGLLTSIPDVIIPQLLFAEGEKSEVVTATLKIEPEQPSFLFLQVAAEFTDADGNSYVCDLPGLEITFQQLFSPIALPPAWSETDLARRNTVQRLFHEFWAHIENLQERTPSSRAELDLVSLRSRSLLCRFCVIHHL